MAVWFNTIISGLVFYMVIAAVLFVPFEALKVAFTKRINVVEFGINQMLSLYAILLVALCFFPLPDASVINSLTYRIQAVPFFCLYDIVKDPSVTSVFQVLFNIALTIPFGAFLKFRFNVSKRVAVLSGILLSLVIEFIQLTGLLFVFQGSYRVCDIDDVMLNTFGCVLGYMVMNKVMDRIPSVESFTRYIDKKVVAVSK